MLTCLWNTNTNTTPHTLTSVHALDTRQRMSGASDSGYAWDLSVVVDEDVLRTRVRSISGAL
ncbi:hypothetical protein BDZ89DRAFT_1074949, partial [Hymenopellis radicata]